MLLGCVLLALFGLTASAFAAPTVSAALSTANGVNEIVISVAAEAIGLAELDVIGWDNDGKAIIYTREFTSFRNDHADTVTIPLQEGVIGYEFTVTDNEGSTGFCRLEPVFHTVSFSMGGIGTAPQSYQAAEGSLLAEPAGQSVSGYTFDGWYPNDTCTEPWDFSEDTMPGEDLTLYARWTQVMDGNYKVFYRLNGHGGPIDPAAVQTGNAIPQPAAPAENGWEFKGWYTDEALTTLCDFENDTVPDHDVTLYAEWEPKTVNVRYMPNISVDEEPWRETAAKVGETLEVPDEPTRDGYAFGDWCTEPDCTNKWIFTRDTVPPADEDLTFYAKWTVNEYTVHYDMQGHGSRVPDEEVAYGAHVSKPQDPVLTGYAFGGLYTDNACTQAWDFDTDMMPAADLTLYAKWEKMSYKVTFDLNGHGTGPAPADQTIPSGRYVTRPEEPTDGNGWNFLYWAEDPAGEYEWEFWDDPIISKGITLYAVWTEAYVLSFHIVPDMEHRFPMGSGEAIDPGAFDMDITAGTSIRGLGTFMGWFTDPDCEEAFVNGMSMPESNVDLYAKWDNVPTMAVVFNMNGHGVAPEGYGALKAGDTILEPEDPTAAGWKFLGWYRDEAFDYPVMADEFWNRYLTPAFIASLPVTEIPLYAKWEECPVYAVNFVMNGHGTAPAGYDALPIGSSLTVPAEPEETGWKFLGWYADESLETVFNWPVSMPDTDLTVYAKWEKEEDREDDESIFYHMTGDCFKLPATGFPTNQ